jgi:hypothetical protein
MSDENRHIKKFGEFVSKGRYHRSLSHLVVKGKTKSSFFSKSKDFELHVYYTPVKKIILEIITDGKDLDNNKLNLPFKIGDSIETVKKWIDENGYEIIFELNK